MFARPVATHSWSSHFYVLQRNSLSTSHSQYYDAVASWSWIRFTFIRAAAAAAAAVCTIILLVTGVVMLRIRCISQRKYSLLPLVSVVRPFVVLALLQFQSHGTDFFFFVLVHISPTEPVAVVEHGMLRHSIADGWPKNNRGSAAGLWHIFEVLGRFLPLSSLSRSFVQETVMSIANHSKVVVKGTTT